jgi:hypothetical protein
VIEILIRRMKKKRKKQKAIIERTLAAGTVAAILAALVLVRQINPSESHLFPFCPFHALTNLNCPGCGATRGMHALLNGDVLTALRFNLLLVIFAPLIFYAVLSLLFFAMRGRGLAFPIKSPNAAWWFAILLLVFGVVRNLPFYPFTIFKL